MVCSVASFCLIVAVGFGVSPVTARSDGDALNFVMLGDWGGQKDPPYTTKTELEVADKMGKIAEQIGSQFTIALGDNFYHDGVKDVNDHRFQTTFENVFTASSLQNRWYVVLGNHDHYGNESAEIAYTKVSKRWYIPDNFYTESFTIPGSSATVQIVFIDTVILAGLTDPFRRDISPSGPQSVQAADDHWKWIEDTMSASTAQWLIVCGHYPVWSVAEHGPTDLLVARLRPMLSKYKATAYFCGHDHDIQHIKEKNDTVNYFVSGAGHLSDSSVAHEEKIPSQSLKFRYGPTDPFSSHGGFNSVSITKDTMIVTFYDTSGSAIYNTTLTPTRN